MSMTIELETEVRSLMKEATELRAEVVKLKSLVKTLDDLLKKDSNDNHSGVIDELHEQWRRWMTIAGSHEQLVNHVRHWIHAESSTVRTPRDHRLNEAFREWEIRCGLETQPSTDDIVIDDHYQEEEEDSAETGRREYFTPRPYGGEE